MQGIEWLNEIDAKIAKGEKILACPGLIEKEWVIGKPLQQLKPIAQRVADAKKGSVNIVYLVPQQETMPGDLLLVPTKIGDSPDLKSVPPIKWSLVDTKEAAEMMRDVKFGPSPFFGVQVEEVVEPSAAAKSQQF